MSYALRRRLVEIARREVGTMEHPRNSNKGKRIQEYQRATWLDGTGWPYCAAFVCWCVREWGKDQAVRDALKLTKAGFEKWRPKTPAAYGLHEWGRQQGLYQIDENANPGEYVLHTADLVTFDFSHCGILETDEAGRIFTIEGNTDAGGSREGGGVYAKTRARSAARRFIRLMP